MKPISRALAAISLVIVFSAFAADQTPTVDWNTVAKIREEGLQRSQVMDITGYIVDVLGARLTNSEDMKRAQAWVRGKMEQFGLENVVIEPFMDYGVTWDNDYFSLHMLEPDYQPKWRTNGAGLPGYAAGWFKLRNKEKALVFLTDRSRVVYIPTNKDYSVLLSVREAEEFADAIQQW